MTDFLKQLLTDLPWSDEFATRLWEAHEWQEMHVEDPKIAADSEAEQETEEDLREMFRENMASSREIPDDTFSDPTPHFSPMRRIIELLERQVELLEALVAAEFSSQQTTDKMLKLFLSSSGASSESDPFKAFSAQRLLGGNGPRRREE